MLGCPECGHSYTPNPPDDNHPTVSLEEEYAKKNADGTVVRMIYDCEKCMKPITLYWYRQKLVAMRG